MSFIVELEEHEISLLKKLLAGKAKEIHYWEAATKDTRRQDEYHAVVDLQQKICAVGRR